MKARYEIGILFLFHNPLKLQGKPENSDVHLRKADILYKILLFRYFRAISVHDVLEGGVIYREWYYVTVFYLDDNDER